MSRKKDKVLDPVPAADTILRVLKREDSEAEPTQDTPNEEERFASLLDYLFDFMEEGEDNFARCHLRSGLICEGRVDDVCYELGEVIIVGASWFCFSIRDVIAIEQPRRSKAKKARA